MLHKATSTSEDRWRIAALVSMMLFLGVLWLWFDPPGQLYNFNRNGSEYSVRADFGRLLLLRWSAQAGLDIIWNFHVWPLAALTALLPVWASWRFGAYRPKQPRGFRVEKRRTS